jgi:hypothetical protein
VLLTEKNLPADNVLDADICIAGAGPAGISIARELQNSGLDVVMLESGGLKMAVRAQALNIGENIGLPYAELRDCRSRVLGGTTAQWAGMCATLDEDDFAKRDWIPDSGWPIDRDELIPYYRQAQLGCDIGHYDYDGRALARRLNYEPIPLDPSLLETVVVQMSAPTRFGAKYRQELNRASDLRLYLGVNLVDMVLNESANHLTSLRCATFSGRKFEVRARRFVLALGGIENPRMLLASNRQNPAGVANSSDAVGRYFLENPHYLPGAYAIVKGIDDLNLYEHLNEVDTRYGESEEIRRATILCGMSLTQAVRRREKLMGVSCFITSKSMPGVDQPTSSVAGEQIQALLGRRPGDYQLLRVNVRAEQTPLADSRITLSSEQDELGVPRPQLDWRIRQQDGRDIRRTLELIAAEFGRARLGRMWIPHEGPEYTGKCQWGFHHMGTTRMGDSSRDSVVDRNCRSHDVDNLYIAGSSVFRTCGFAHPTLTLIALAHRLGAHLRDAS